VRPAPTLGFIPPLSAGLIKRKYLGEKIGFFSARLKTPFKENAPVKFYFPLQTTFHAAKN
jgi:hypothetical protein